MSTFNELYQDTNIQSGYGLPDGKYECSILNVNFFTETNDKPVKIQWTFKVLDGAHSEIAFDFWLPFSNEDSAKGNVMRSIFKKTLVNLGINGLSENEIQEQVISLIGSVVSLQLKTGGNGYQNCYVNRLVCKAAPPVQDDIIPF